MQYAQHHVHLHFSHTHSNYMQGCEDAHLVMYMTTQTNVSVCYLQHADCLIVGFVVITKPKFDLAHARNVNTTYELRAFYRQHSALPLQHNWVREIP